MGKPGNYHRSRGKCHNQIRRHAVVRKRHWNSLFWPAVWSYIFKVTCKCRLPTHSTQISTPIKQSYTCFSACDDSFKSTYSSHELDDTFSPSNAENFVESTDEEASDCEMLDELRDSLRRACTENKYVIFHSNLLRLFDRCSGCGGQVLDKKNLSRGSGVIVQSLSEFPLYWMAFSATHQLYGSRESPSFCWYSVHWEHIF